MEVEVVVGVIVEGELTGVVVIKPLLDFRLVAQAVVEVHIRVEAFVWIVVVKQPSWPRTDRVLICKHYEWRVIFREEHKRSIAKPKYGDQVHDYHH